MKHTIMEKTQQRRSTGEGVRYLFVLSQTNPGDASWNSRVYVSKDMFDFFQVGDAVFFSMELAPAERALPEVTA